MFAGISEPFLSSDDVGDFHFPVVDNIGEVESWPAIFFDDNKIIKLGKRNNPVILINENRRNLKKIASDSDSIRLPFENLFLDLSESQFGTFSIVGSWR
jgi:hypothetical protein